MRPLRRVFALVTLTAFGVQALGVVNFAHAASQADAPSPPGFVQATQGLAQVVPQVQALLATIQEKAARGEDTSAELRELQGTTQSLQALLSQLQGQLDASAQRFQAFVQEGKVPGEVLTRFEAFRADFGNATTEVLASLAALQAPSPTPLGQRAEAVRGALQPLQAAQPLRITQDKVDPTKLPHRRSDLPRRKPEAYPAITYAEPPGPQDLTPTVDAPLTSEIQALAAEKNFDPLELFRFVHNSMQFEPYFGSLKGAQGTLLEKAGNDMDQASLLIALLRASNIPARYVAGVVELRIKKVMNWVGVETPQAAAEAFVSNGIPAEARTEGDGTITHLVFFHVWAEAFLPDNRGPNRGRGRGADPRSQWVQLDPSFKRHEFREGVDLTAATGFDVNAVLQGATSGATINQASSFFTNLNESFIQRELTRLTDNLLAFVQAELGPEATVGDVLGTKRIKPFNRGPRQDRRGDRGHSLDDVLPFETVTPQLEVAELPQSFRHLVNFAMFGFSRLFALPELAGKRVTVSYVAATPADQALIDAFRGILNVFPAFLVDLKPQLKVEGQLIAEGQGVPLGSSQILRSAFLRPLGTAFDINDKIVTTGADYAIALNLQRISLEGLRARLERFSSFLASLGPTPLLSSEIVEEALHLTGQAYFLEVDVQNEIAAKTAKVIFTREPSEAFVFQDLSVLFFFGFPVIVNRGSVGIDVKRNIVNPISVVGDARQEVSWLLTSGSFGSAAEHAIFEQLYGVPSVSTERLLALANSQSVRIFTIDGTNIDRILPQLDTFAIVKQNISESVNAGLVAVVPQRNLRFNDWLGMGWIVVNPNTGSAGYLIAGFLTAGGSTSSPADVSLFNEKAIKEQAALTLIAGLAGAVIPSGVAITATGGALISEAIVTGSVILGVTGAGLVLFGAALVVGAVAAAVYLVPKILAADISRKRRWFAFHLVSVTST